MEHRYRKLYPRIWRQPAFAGMDHTDRLLALYCLTGPQSNRAGFHSFSPGTAAEDLGLTVNALQRRLAAVCEAFGWRFDRKARVLLIPSWWTWNPPENPNVLRAAFKDAREVPATPLVNAFAEGCAKVSQRFGVWFAEPSCQRSPNQDQDQEQVQEQEQDGPPAASAPAGVDGAAAERLLEAWNAETTAPIPKALTLGKSRLRKVEARLREHPPAWWLAAIRRVEASAFCRGTNDRGWVATFDWLMANDENGAKVVEGKYDDRQPGAWTPAHPNAAPAADAYARADEWCAHDPRCATHEWHALRLRQEAEADGIGA